MTEQTTTEPATTAEAEAGADLLRAEVAAAVAALDLPSLARQAVAELHAAAGEEVAHAEVALPPAADKVAVTLERDLATDAAAHPAFYRILLVVAIATAVGLAVAFFGFLLGEWVLAANPRAGEILHGFGGNVGTILIALGIGGTAGAVFVPQPGQRRP